jgi:hypothetical protein
MWPGVELRLVVWRKMLGELALPRHGKAKASSVSRPGRRKLHPSTYRICRAKAGLERCELEIARGTCHK